MGTSAGRYVGRRWSQVQVGSGTKYTRQDLVKAEHRAGEEATSWILLSTLPGRISGAAAASKGVPGLNFCTPQMTDY